MLAELSRTLQQRRPAADWRQQCCVRAWAIGSSCSGAFKAQAERRRRARSYATGTRQGGRRREDKRAALAGGPCGLRA